VIETGDGKMSDYSGPVDDTVNLLDYRSS